MNQIPQVWIAIFRLYPLNLRNKSHELCFAGLGGNMMRADVEHFPVPAKTRRKILFFVTEDWFFTSHFIGFAHIAARLGMEVLLCSSINEKRNELESLPGYVYWISTSLVVF